MWVQGDRALWCYPPLDSSDFGLMAAVLQNKSLVGQKCRGSLSWAGPSAVSGALPRMVGGRHCAGLNLWAVNVAFSFVQLCQLIKQLGFFFLVDGHSALKFSHENFNLIGARTPGV